MTASELSAQHETPEAREEPSAESGAGERVVWVDPRELIIGDNVRTDVRLDKGFVADIKDRGVRQVIPVQGDGQGRWVVLTGQKRVLAAIEAGLDRVRVLVEPSPDTDGADSRVARILEQLGENEHRAAITDADEARATQQLLVLGLSAGQIARRRHIGTKRVRTAAVVAGNPTAMDAVAEGRLDLAQAAVLAEFADDPVAVEALTSTARTRPEQFDHLTQQLRDQRTEERLRAELTAALTAQGVRVIERPDTVFGGRVRRLSELRATPDTAPGTELTAEAHAACPGHGAFVDDRGSWRPVGERVVAVWVCTDAPAYGHADRYGGTGIAATGRPGGPMSEEQKAQRRTVIANNKAWDSATTVRREWLRTVLTRKSAPADGARWIAHRLAQGSPELRKAMQSDHQLAADLLGLPRAEGGDTHPIASVAAAASPGRAITLSVAIVIGALEDSLDRQAWRAPTREQVAYFHQLQAWNYPLSDVERLVLTPTDTDNGDDVDEDTVDSTGQDTQDTSAPDTDPVTAVEDDLVA